MFKKTLLALLTISLWSAITGAAGAAIVALDAPAPAKALLAIGLLVALLLFYRLNDIEREIDEARIAARVAFIAAETAKHNPSDARSAFEILKQDLAAESEKREALDMMGARGIAIEVRILAFVVWVVISLVVAIPLIDHWAAKG